MSQIPRALRVWITGIGLLLLSSCTGGVKAGGEEPTSNGGIAFIVFTIMLLVTGLVMWLILGRRD